jgi:hypothetical protein
MDLNPLQTRVRMKWNQFFGGLLIGAALGLMIGGAVVRLPDDGSGNREYPFGPALLLAMVGGISARGRRALFPRRDRPVESSGGKSAH